MSKRVNVVLQNQSNYSIVRRLHSYFLIIHKSVFLAFIVTVAHIQIILSASAVYTNGIWGFASDMFDDLQ